MVDGKDDGPTERAILLPCIDSLSYAGSEVCSATRFLLSSLMRAAASLLIRLNSSCSEEGSPSLLRLLLRSVGTTTTSFFVAELLSGLTKNDGFAASRTASAAVVGFD